MIRAMWTAASGMKAMQFSVDTIANNLANVSTYGYKKERPEFQDLLYVTMQKAVAPTEEDPGQPVNLQVGHGVLPRATVRDFTMGNLEQTSNPLDMAVEGDGFFQIQMPDGTVRYTRDGAFKLSVTEEGNMITTSRGFPVLDRDGVPIIFTQQLADITFTESGEVTYRDEDGLNLPTGQFIGLHKFQNRQGLEAVGGNLFAVTSGSGEAIPDTELGDPSFIRSGYLESSNVAIVEEMVKMISSQRAYELNSKAITTSDEMLQTANALRR
jgi:flagellar basal-body rod protein FlgG